MYNNDHHIQLLRKQTEYLFSQIYKIDYKIDSGTALGVRLENQIN